MSRAKYSLVSVGRNVVTISDDSCGRPCPSVTNDAEAVVKELLQTYPGRRIFYYDSCQALDELKHDGERFTGFAPGPQGRETVEEFCCPGHQWNMSAGEADENNISGEGEQVIRCNLCGANGDA